MGYQSEGLSGRATFVTIAASTAPAIVRSQADYVAPATGWETAVQALIMAATGYKVLMVGTFIKGTIAGITVPSNIEIELQGSMTFITNVGDGAVMFAASGVSNIKFKGGSLAGNRANQVGVQNGITLTNVTLAKIDMLISGFTGKAVTQSGGHSNSVVNQLYPLVDPLVVQRPLMSDMLSHPNVSLVDTIENDGTWTVFRGALAWDTTNKLVGAAGAKLTTSTWGTTKWRAVSYKTYATSISVNPNNFIGYFIKVPADAGTTGMDCYLTLTDSAANAAVLYVSQHVVSIPGYRIEGNWVFMGAVPIASSFPTVNWNDIKEVRIELLTPISDTYFCYVDGLYEVSPIYPQGSVTITMDDSHASRWETVMPLMESYGYKAVAYINPGNLSTAESITQTKLLYDAGWDIANHTWAHENLTTVTLGEAEEAVYKAHNWLIENDMVDRAVSFAYTFGASNKAATELVHQLYPISRQIYGNAVQRFGSAMFEAYNMRSQRISDALLAECKLRIDVARATGAHIIFDFHHVGAGMDITLANLTDLLNYIQASGVKVVTFSELVRMIKDKGYIEPSGTATITRLAAPAAATATEGAAGNVDVGDHSWKVTLVNVEGEETEIGTKSNVVTIAAAAKIVNLTNVPVGAAGTASRKIYRTEAGDVSDYKLVGTIADNTTTTFTDNIADVSLGAVGPAANGTGYVRTITHGLGTVPTRVQVTLTSDPGAANAIWVSDKVATTFKVNAKVQVTASTTFDWRVVKEW